MRGYWKTKDSKRLLKFKDSYGDHDGVIRLLLRNNRIAEALDYASYCETEKISISKCYQVQWLTNHYAEEMSTSVNLKSKESFSEFEAVLKFLPPIDQVSYLKVAGMIKEACAILLKEERYKEVYRIYKGQCWHGEGITLASSQNNEAEELNFILFKAAYEMKNTIMDRTVRMLEMKCGSCSNVAEASTNLILGMATNNFTLIRTAHDYYKSTHLLIGSTVAFHIALSKAEYDASSENLRNFCLKEGEDPSVLLPKCYKEIQILIETLCENKEHSLFQRQLIRQVETFYGLERKILDQHCEVYCSPPSCYPWTNQLLEGLQGNKDVDGILQLDMKLVFQNICNFLKSMIKRWIVDDEVKLVQLLIHRLNENLLHQQMITGGYLAYCVTQLDIQHYLSILSAAYDFNHYGNMKIDSSAIIKALFSLFSPQATCYLPSSALVINSYWLIQAVRQKSDNVLNSIDFDFNFDDWFNSWRMKCITKEGVWKMWDTLSNHQMQDKQSPVYVPVGKSFLHIMLLWLRTCDLFQEGMPFLSCNITVHDIIKPIASEKFLWNSISISNLLSIVSVHAVAILTMYAAYYSIRFNHKGNVYVPSSYFKQVEVYCNMNEIKHDFLRMCVNDIEKREDSLPIVIKKLKELLIILLKVMIGRHNITFNPLKYALSEEKCLQNHEAKHCLVFVITLFSNIGLMFGDDNELQAYKSQIYESVKHCEVPALKEACQNFATCTAVSDAFETANRLLHTCNDSLFGIKIFTSTSKSTEIELYPVNVMLINRRQLLAIPIKKSGQQSHSVLRATAKPFYPSAATLHSVTLSKASLVDFPLPSTEIDEIDHEIMDALCSNIDYPKPPKFVNENPVVSQYYCHVCACPLVSDYTQHESLLGARPVDVNLVSVQDPYSTHCSRKEHLLNLKMFHIFDDKEKRVYICYERYLLEFISKSSVWKKYLRTEIVQVTVDSIEKELYQCETELQRIKEKADWQCGIKFLQENIFVKLYNLKKKVEGLIAKAESKKLKIELEMKEQNKQEEEEWDVEDQQNKGEEEISPRNPGALIKQTKRSKKKK